VIVGSTDLFFDCSVTGELLSEFTQSRFSLYTLLSKNMFQSLCRNLQAICSLLCSPGRPCRLVTNVSEMHNLLSEFTQSCFRLYIVIYKPVVQFFLPNRDKCIQDARVK
jgi:hypothetical protein